MTMDRLEHQIEALLASEAQKNAQEGVSHFVAGAVTAILDSKSPVLTEQGFQLGVLIAWQAITVILKDPILLQQMEAAIAEGKSMPDQPNLDSINQLIHWHVNAVATQWHSKVCDRITHLNLLQRQITELRQEVLQQQKIMDSNQKRLAAAHERHLKHVKAEKEKVRKINHEKLYRHVEITAWLLKTYAQSLSTLAIAVGTTWAIAIPVISYSAIRLAASEGCSSNHICFGIVQWMIHEPPTAQQQDTASKRKP
jgi:hypothetical protein